jgi:hypothetical protein
MAGAGDGYLPSAPAIIGAYARALDQLCELPAALWKAIAEAAYAEDPTMTTLSTTVYLLGAETQVDVTVSAVRLALDGSSSASVTATVDPPTIGPDTADTTVAARVTIKDTTVGPIYRLQFSAPAGGWPKQSRLVNFTSAEFV